MFRASAASGGLSFDVDAGRARQARQEQGGPCGGRLDAGQRLQAFDELLEEPRDTGRFSIGRGGSCRRNASTPLVAKPGSSLFSAMKLRINRPAPTSSTSAMASSLTASAARRRPPRRPSVPVRPPSLRGPPESRRDAWRAGTRPNRRLVNIEAPAAYASTWRSMAISDSLGNSAGASV